MRRCLFRLTLVIAALVLLPRGENCLAEPDSRDGEFPVASPELSRRPPPLRELDVERTLDVADFGALPNDDKNDLPAVREAIEKVRLDKIPTEIVFKPGRYIFDTDLKTDEIGRVMKTALWLYLMENVVVNGNGAEIVIRNPGIGFLKVIRSKNVIIKDLSVDWDPPPFAQGTIRRIDVEGKTFDLEEDPGYMGLDHPEWKREAPQNIGPTRWGVILDPNQPGLLKSDALNVVFYEGWKKNDDGTQRITVQYGRVLGDMTPGDRYVQVNRIGAGFVTFGGSERVTCLNLTNYTSPGLDYGGGDCSEIAIINCRVLLKPGRWHTSNADGLHFARNRIGPWVEGCTFEAMTDDGANLYTSPTYCTEVLGPRRFDLTNVHVWRPGDRILAFNPRDGLKIAEVHVAEIEARSRGEATVTFDADVPSFQTGSEKSDDCFFNLDCNSSKFVFRNNTFRNIRRFGILIQSRDGIIENNRFEATSSNGLVVRNSVDWPEGFATGNLIIRGNTFRNCGFDHTMGMHHAAVIGLEVQKLGAKPAAWRALSRIVIEDNTIINWRRQGIYVGCAEDVVVRNNRLLTEGDPPPPFRDLPLVPMRFFNVDRLIATGNQIDDPRDILPEGFVIESSGPNVIVRDQRVNR